MLFSEGDLSKHNKTLNVYVQSYISVVINKLLPCYVTGQRGRFPPAGEIFALQPLHVAEESKVTYGHRRSGVDPPRYVLRSETFDMMILAGIDDMFSL